MKKIKIILCLLFLVNVSFSQEMQTDSNEILTNNNILNMVGAKISKKIILSKIQTTNNSFDLSADAIVKLANSDVSDELILTMLDFQNKKSKEQEKLTNDDIIKMTVSNISKKIVLKKINSSNNNFDLKSDELIKFSNNKVSDEVVMAIMATKNQDKNTSKTTNDNVSNDKTSAPIEKNTIEKTNDKKTTAPVETLTTNNSNDCKYDKDEKDPLTGKWHKAIWHIVRTMAIFSQIGGWTIEMDRVGDDYTIKNLILLNTSKTSSDTPLEQGDEFMIKLDSGKLIVLNAKKRVIPGSWNDGKMRRYYATYPISLEDFKLLTTAKIVAVRLNIGSIEYNQEIKDKKQILIQQTASCLMQ